MNRSNDFAKALGQAEAVDGVGDKAAEAFNDFYMTSLNLAKEIGQKPKEARTPTEEEFVAQTAKFGLLFMMTQLMKMKK